MLGYVRRPRRTWAFDSAVEGIDEFCERGFFAVGKRGGEGGRDDGDDEGWDQVSVGSRDESESEWLEIDGEESS